MTGSRPCDAKGRVEGFRLSLSAQDKVLANKMIAPREVIVIIVRPFTYDSDAHIISGRKNMIRIENLTPQLTAEECMEQRRCIEEGLFEVFIKYEKHNENDSYLGAAAV